MLEDNKRLWELIRQRTQLNEQIDEIISKELNTENVILERVPCHYYGYSNKFQYNIKVTKSTISPSSWDSTRRFTIVEGKSIQDCAERLHDLTEELVEMYLRLISGEFNCLEGSDILEEL